MSKQRYLYVEGEKIPVSEEVYKVYYHFFRKERYFSEDLKREKLLYAYTGPKAPSARNFSPTLPEGSPTSTR